MLSDAKLEKALIDATRNIFRTDQDSLTVNAVRTRAECNIDLDEGFFKLGAWKSRSKLVIQTEAVSCAPKRSPLTQLLIREIGQAAQRRLQCLV